MPTQLPDFDIFFDQVEAKSYIPLSEHSKNLATQSTDLPIEKQVSEKVSDLIYSRINNMSNILKELRGNTSVNSFKIKP